VSSFEPFFVGWRLSIPPPPSFFSFIDSFDSQSPPPTAGHTKKPDSSITPSRHRHAPLALFLPLHPPPPPTFQLTPGPWPPPMKPRVLHRFARYPTYFNSLPYVLYRTVLLQRRPLCGLRLSSCGSQDLRLSSNTALGPDFASRFPSRHPSPVLHPERFP